MLLPLPVEIEALAEEFCYDTDLEPAAVLAEWQKRFGTQTYTYEAKG